MDKYKDKFRAKVKPAMDYETGQYGVQPFRDAQTALAKATFAKEEREQFFTDAYADILTDLFYAWLKTEPHAQKEREYLYSTAMALGSVKEKLLSFETMGRNAQYINTQEAGKEEGSNE
jgi:hypothetical protein